MRRTPIHGVFTDKNEAAEAVDLFADTEATHLKKTWADKWPLFSSRFYMEKLPADIPAQKLAEAMFRNND